MWGCLGVAAVSTEVSKCQILFFHGVTTCPTKLHFKNKQTNKQTRGGEEKEKKIHTPMSLQSMSHQAHTVHLLFPPGKRRHCDWPRPCHFGKKKSHDVHNKSLI